MVDRTQTARSVDDDQAIVRSLEQLSIDSSDILAQVESLESIGATGNPQQGIISDLTYATTVNSATYVQGEIDKLSTDIKLLADKIDSMLSSLRAANIIT